MATQGRIALRARRLQLRDFIGGGALQGIQALFVRRQLRVEIGQLVDVGVDCRNDAGARAAEVTVVREHPARPGGVLLIEQQFQGLLAADHVGGAHLLRQARTHVGHGGRAAALLGGHAGAMGGALGALATQVRQLRTPRGHRHFGGLQGLGAAIGLDRILADLVANGRDLGLQCLKLRLCLCLADRGPGPPAARRPAAAAARPARSTMRRD